MSGGGDGLMRAQNAYKAQHVEQGAKADGVSRSQLAGHPVEKGEKKDGLFARLMDWLFGEGKSLDQRNVSHSTFRMDPKLLAGFSNVNKNRAKRNLPPLSENEYKNLAIVMTKPQSLGGAGLSSKEAGKQLSSQNESTLYRNHGHRIANEFRASEALPKLNQQEYLVLLHFMMKAEGGDELTRSQATSRMGVMDKGMLFEKYGYASQLGKGVLNGKPVDQIGKGVHQIYDTLAKEALQQVEQKIDVDARVKAAFAAATEAAKHLPEGQRAAKIEEILRMHEEQLIQDISHEYNDYLNKVGQPLEELRGDMQKRLSGLVYQHDKKDADAIIRGEMAGLDARVNSEAKHALNEYMQARTAAVQALVGVFASKTSQGDKSEALERVNERVRNWESYEKEHKGHLAVKPKTLESGVVEVVVDGDVYHAVQEDQEYLDTHYQEERDRLFKPDGAPLTVGKAKERVAVLQKDMDLVVELHEKYGFYSPNYDSTEQALNAAKADLARVEAEEEQLFSDWRNEMSDAVEGYEEYDKDFEKREAEKKELEAKRLAHEAKMEAFDKRIAENESDGGLDIMSRAGAASAYYDQKKVEAEAANQKQQAAEAERKAQQIEAYAGLKEEELRKKVVAEQGLDAWIRHMDEQRSTQYEEAKAQAVTDKRAALEVNLTGIKDQDALVSNLVSLLKDGNASAKDIEGLVSYLRQIPMDEAFEVFEQVAQQLGDDKDLVYTKLIGSKAFITLAYELKHQTQSALDRAADGALPSKAREEATNRAVLLGQYEEKFLCFVESLVSDDRDYDNDIAAAIRGFSVQQKSGFFSSKQVFQPDVVVAAAVSGIRVRS